MFVCNTKFSLDPFGDGGSKRSVQLREMLLSSPEVEIVEDDFSPCKGLSKLELAKQSARALKFISRNVGWSKYPSFGAKVQAVKHFALRLPVIYDRYKGKEDICFIWENTGPANYSHPYLMKETGAKVIAFPHNLESLVPGQRDVQTGKMSPDWLADEIERLKFCDKVFAISEEESWLLRQHGINASYFPYYPTKAAEAYLLNIREKRERRTPNERRKYLLLGSATNPPTRDGMQKLIDEAAGRDIDFDICVAGYQTESLTIPSSENVNFLGTLSNEELNEWLTIADAMLIYQPPTSGALTRIAEMLVSGVPVFANFDAARSYHRTADVVEYRDFDDLFRLLADFNPHQAVFPSNFRKTIFSI